MDTGVCDLEIACVKANSTWVDDIGSKDLSNRPIYALLNTHNFIDMIFQLKYMPIVMNPARIASSDWKYWKCYGLWYAEFGDSRCFYIFNIILSFSTCSQSFKKICMWELLGANVLKQLERNLKKSRLQRNSKPWPPQYRCDALPTEL